MPEISFQEHISDYCASEYFFFLEPRLKEHAEALLSYWARKSGSVLSSERLKQSLTEVAGLDLPPDVRRGFPRLLTAFLEYLAANGRWDQAPRWAQAVQKMEPEYQKMFRQDGSVRGETVRKSGRDTGPNDPCPCGSGKKFKKCCG